MATKTWKLGEWAKGGVITAIVNKNSIKIQGKEWDFKTAGYSKKGSQSNAKVWTERTFKPMDFYGWSSKGMNFLEDLTSHYYADQITEWIRSKI